MDKIEVSFTVHFQYGAFSLLNELIIGIPSKKDPKGELIEKSRILFEKCINNGFNFKSFTTIQDISDRLDELRKKSEFVFLSIALALVFFYADGSFFYIDLSDEQYKFADKVIKYVKEIILPKTKDSLCYNGKGEILGRT